MLSPTAKTLLRHLQRTALLPAGAKCLIAISGGGDSVALLRLLCELRSPLQLQLFAVHLNHGLRPEADEDAGFTADLCAGMQVPLVSAKADASAYARKHNYSLEEAGRHLRYKLFRKALEQFSAQYLATAHTASDQAETLLMRLIIGTGLNGLCGVRPRRSFGPYTIIRPLLPFEGHELREYLRESGQEWREDSTNHIPDAPRTKIRLQLLPLLKQWNPRIVAGLNSFSAQVRADEAFLQSCTRRLVNSALFRDSGWQISVEQLQRFPAVIRKRAFLHWTKMRCSLSSQHLAALDRLIISGRNRSHLDLPGQLAADINDGLLVIAPRRTVIIPAPLPSQSLTVQPGRYSYPEYRLTLEISRAECSRRPEPDQIFLNPEIIPERLILRTRHPGDVFYPAGGTGRTKLKKYLNECKIPPEQRHSLPLLCCGDDIVWVIGRRADQRYLARPDQPNVWRIRLIREEIASKRDKAQ